MHTADVIPSVTGKLLHTPFIPNRRESVIDMPIISTKPLNTDTTNDSFAISTALKYPADIILTLYIRVKNKKEGNTRMSDKKCRRACIYQGR